MAIDYLDVIRTDGARALAAMEADPSARIPWSDSWTVADCGVHLGGAHHLFARVIAGRPTADFSEGRSLEPPAPSDPDASAWLRTGTAALLDALDGLSPDEPCWTWWPADQTIGFWHRRMAHETLVHRWDLELGAGIAGEPIAPALAADGIDELLDVFVAVSRMVHGSPGDGESVHVHCTDTDGEWLVTFGAPGATELRREHAKGSLAMRGPAEPLLLRLWGRLDADQAEAAGIEVLGDQTVVERWSELVPSM